MADINDELDDPTGLTDREVKSLPVWAQDRLVDLRRALATATEKYDEQFDSQTPTRVIYGDVYNNPRYLPDNGTARVRIGVKDSGGEDSWVDFARRVPVDKDQREYAEIVCMGTMHLSPQASNVIRVYPAGR